MKTSHVSQSCEYPVDTQNINEPSFISIALFYGGVLDLEQLSKIDNMKDLMAAFKKVSPKDLIRKDEDSESEEDETGVETDGERDSDKRSDAIAFSNTKRKKGSSSGGTSRSRNAKPKRKKKRKNKRKESDRADHGNEDDDSPEEEDDDDVNPGADESVDDSEAGDEKIGIGSTPTAAQLQSRLKKKSHRNTVVTPITSTPSSSTTVSPVAIYPNPYVYSMPYNYPQLQLQYMQQLQAMQQQASQTAALALRQGSQKNSDKFPEEELTASSPNENRNVINVNIADPHKSSSSSSGDSVSYNSDSSSVSSQVASRFPLRRGSFNSMANGLARKALSSIFHRIFPTMKHLNVKGVAAKGCRDVQSIGSLDSIIMPLGLAVTLHPLLLPLVPFLLLALGSIKAIESATCFVSEYFS